MTPGRSAKLLTLSALAVLPLCLGPGANPFVSGPIVQQVEATSAVVLLHSAANRRLRLVVERADGSQVRVAETRATKRHAMRVDGLTAGQTYAYRVVDGERVVGRGRFRTAVASRVSFVAVGDSGKIPFWLKWTDDLPVGPSRWMREVLPGRGHQWEVARAIERCDPDLLLHLGDVVYPEGRRAHYAEALFLPFARLLARVPFYPAIGNHDLMTEGGAPFHEAFALPTGANDRRAYYEFTRGPVRFVCLDTFTAAFDASSPQFAWLERVLQQAREPWKVVFTHRPFWTESRSKRDLGNRVLREQVHPLLAKYRVTLVLSGHDHVYERFAPKDGVSYVVAGAGGKSIYEVGSSESLVAVKRDHSFVTVDATPTELRLRAITADGEAFDEWRAGPRR